MRNNVWILGLLTALSFMTTAYAQNRGGGMGGGPGGVFRVAAHDAVQKELGLASDVATKVKDVTEDFNATVRDAMARITGGTNPRDMSREERQKFMEKSAEVRAKATEKYLPKLKEALTVEQYARVQQINYQLQDVAALADSDVAQAVKLSPEQQTKIKDINAEFNEKGRALFGGGGGQDALRELMTERRDKIHAVLSKEQQDQFAALKGKPFAQLEDLRAFGRGNR